MNHKKLYGIFSTYQGRTLGYVGPSADRISSPADVVKLGGSFCFSKTHVKVFSDYESANKKNINFRARRMTNIFIARISKHNGPVTMDLKARYAVTKGTKNISLAKFNVNTENKKTCLA